MISTRWSAFVIAAAMWSLGCASTRTLRTDPAQDSQVLSRMRSQESINIVGYTARGGVHKNFTGTLRLENGQFIFTPHSNLAATFTLPVQEVESVDVIESSANERTVVLMLAIAAILFGLYIANVGMGFDGL